MSALFAVTHLQLPPMAVGTWNCAHVVCGPGRYKRIEPFSAD
jgi:hypothetical protein